MKFFTMAAFVALASQAFSLKMKTESENHQLEAHQKAPPKESAASNGSRGPHFDSHNGVPIRSTSSTTDFRG